MEVLPSNVSVTFDAFYAEYSQQVLRYLEKKMRSQEDAEDLTADVFEYCYRKFHTFDPARASIKTWLYMIVNSRYKNYLRDHRCFEDVDDYRDLVASDDTPMEQAVEVEEERQILARVLQMLPERQRKIVILKYFSDMTSGQIAERLGMTESNVRVQLFRAMKQLQELLKEYGG